MEIRPDEFNDFSIWFGTAAREFVIAVPLLVFLAIFICFLISAVRRGPAEAFYSVAGVIATALGKDLPSFSLRRILAVMRLTIKESIRRRVVVAFVAFVLILLFAGWFLDEKSDDPTHIYLSIVLTWTNFLVILLGLFLGTVSIPADIKSKVIYTVMTKPVRAGELVLGRILGFIAVVTVLLIPMGIISYISVVRGAEHEHQVNPEAITAIPPPAEGLNSPGWEGTTTLNSGHRHTWTVDEQGQGVTNRVMGHDHMIALSEGEDPKAPRSYVLGAPEGNLVARVPIYGELQFLDREGNPATKGISVGQEWGYRSYIEGRTLASAIWTFRNISEKDFPDHLPLALTLSVFRTFKGDIVTGVRGIIILRSTDPRNRLQSEPIGFESKEFQVQQLQIPRKLRPMGEAGTSNQEIDIFEDLVHEGSLEVIVRCDDRAQYFGMAQSDVYIEAPNASFAWNFAKAYITFWLQVTIVICLGVTLSTFLSTPVAILGTVSAILLGYFGSFVQDLWSGEAFGGGPIESLIRLINQDNVVKPLEFGTGDIGVQVVKFLDNILIAMMHVMSGVLPDFSGLGRAAQYVAFNFNFYDQLLARQCLTTFIYVTAISIIGYFFLRTREIAA